VVTEKRLSDDAENNTAVSSIGSNEQSKCWLVTIVADIKFLQVDKVSDVRWETCDHIITQWQPPQSRQII